MRRLLAILAALALLATIPAAVTAKKPTRFNDHFVAIHCEGIAPTSGTGFLFLGVSISDEFGPDAFVDMWNAASPDGPPDITRDFDAPVDASYVGGTLTASIPLLDSIGRPCRDRHGLGDADARRGSVLDRGQLQGRQRERPLHREHAATRRCRNRGDRRQDVRPRCLLRRGHDDLGVAHQSEHVRRAVRYVLSRTAP